MQFGRDPLGVALGAGAMGALMKDEQGEQGAAEQAAVEDQACRVDAAVVRFGGTRAVMQYPVAAAEIDFVMQPGRIVGAGLARVRIEKQFRRLGRAWPIVAAIVVDLEAELAAPIVVERAEEIIDVIGAEHDAGKGAAPFGDVVERQAGAVDGLDQVKTGALACPVGDQDDAPGQGDVVTGDGHVDRSAANLLGEQVETDDMAQFWCIGRDEGDRQTQALLRGRVDPVRPGRAALRRRQFAPVLPVDRRRIGKSIQAGQVAGDIHFAGEALPGGSIQCRIGACKCLQ